MLEAIPHLNDAMNGLPTERKAVGTIAVISVIPLAGVGIVAGGFLAPKPLAGPLYLWGTGGGVLAAAVALASVFGVYRLFGFRAVAGMAAFYSGTIAGGMIGWLILTLLNLPWALLLAPVCGVLNVVFRPFFRPKANPPAEPLKLGEWWRQKEW